MKKNSLLNDLTAIVWNVSENNDFSEAFRQMRESFPGMPTETSKRLEELENRYFYYLRFIADGNNGDISEFKLLFFEIVREFVNTIRRMDNDAAGAQLRYEALRPEETLESLVSDYLAEADRLRTDTRALTQASARETLDRLAADIFNRLWVLMYLSDDVYRLMDSIITDAEVSAIHRELWINGIGLALLNMPKYVSVTSDAEPFLRLLSGLMTMESGRLKVAAFAWLCLYVYTRRDHLQVFDASIYSLLDYNDAMPLAMFEGHMLNLYRTLNKSRNSGADAAMQSDLISLMSKLRPGADGMPDMSGLDASDYEHIQSFISRQKKGEDFFAATLGANRDFPFFTNLANWFLPFDASHSALGELTDGEGAVVADMVSELSMIADSDKYAMLLSLCSMPAAMRDGLVSKMADGLMMLRNAPEFEMQPSQSERLSEAAHLNKFMHGFNRFLRHNKYAVENLAPLFSADFSVSWMEFSGYFDEVATVTVSKAVEMDEMDIATDIYCDYAYELGIQKEFLIKIFGKDEDKAATFIPYVAENYEEDIDILVALLGYVNRNIDRSYVYYDYRSYISAYVSRFRMSDVIESGNLRAIEELANYSKNQNDFENSETLFHTLAYLSEDRAGAANSGLGVISYIRGDFESALQYFEKSDKSGEAGLYYSFTLWMLNRRREAAKVYDEIMQSDQGRLSRSCVVEIVNKLRNTELPVSRTPGFDTLLLLNDLRDFGREEERFGKI